MSANLIGDVKVTQAIGYTAGALATGTLNGAVLDMTGYRGVLAIVAFGTVTAGAATSLKMQQDTVVGMGSAADLAGTGQTVLDTDDDKIFYVDLQAPTKQFVRLVVLRATQSSAVYAVYLQYRGRTKPSVQPSGVGGESWITPAEGSP